MLALLISEAVTLLATRAASPPASLQTQELAFYYKQDEPVRYLDLKNRQQLAHPGELSPERQAGLSRQAYEEAAVEAPLNEWRSQGGPTPRIFSGKLHLYNAGREALLNVPLQVTVRALVGDLQPDPVLHLTNYARLEETARWETLPPSTVSLPPSSVVSVPAIAPDADKRIEVMKFELLPFLATHPGRWPLQLEITVRSPHLATRRRLLMLIPDHFAISNGGK
jgi:hypothetical protein